MGQGWEGKPYFSLSPCDTLPLHMSCYKELVHFIEAGGCTNFYFSLKFLFDLKKACC
jgi:hypothetical protein